MKKTNNIQTGFTLTELLVAISIVGILGGLLLTGLARAKATSSRIKCVNNLGQIGLAFKGFADSNDNRLPWQLTPSRLKYYFGSEDPKCLQAIFSLQAMKKEIGGAKLLASPCDGQVAPPNELAEENWSTYDTLAGKMIPCEAISYYLIEGADMARPRTMLAATRNLSTADLATARLVGANEKSPQGIVLSGLNNSQGQAVFADGSARPINDSDIGAEGQVTKSHQNSFGGASIGPASTTVIGCCGGGVGDPVPGGVCSTFYVGSDDKKVYALDGKTGAKKWEFETGGRVFSSLAIGADGTVYVGSEDSKVYALNGKTGTKKWEFVTGGVYSSPAIGTDGTVYIGSWDNKVYALNGRTGAKRWEFVTGDELCSSPAIGADGTVYVGSYDKKVYALNGKTGAKLWEFVTGSCVPSSPAIGADGTVYIGSRDFKVYALDGKTGAKKWEFVTGSCVDSSPAIGADGTVYVGSYDKKVYALDGKTGAKKWEFETGERVASSPAIGADGTVYVGSNDNKVYALDYKTGAKKWEFGTGAKVRSSPAIGGDGTVYVGSGDFKVYALDGKTGTKKWEFITGNRVYSSPAITRRSSFRKKSRESLPKVR